VVGPVEAREAAAGWFSRRELETRPEQVLFAPGSKALLFRPARRGAGGCGPALPLVGQYSAQARCCGEADDRLCIPADAGGVPDPERLEGAGPAVLIAYAVGNEGSVTLKRAGRSL
jgi:aspartate aminotransferase